MIGTIWTIQLVSTCLAIVCNISGLIAIHFYHKKTNQNIILAFISITEMLLSICNFIILFTKEEQSFSLMTKICIGAKWVLGFFLMFGMYTLTLDRIICIINPLQYEVRLTRKRLQMFLMVGIIFTLVVKVPIQILMKKKTFIYVFFGTMVLHGIYVMFTMITYSIAFYKVRRSARNLHATGTIQGEKVKKLLLVPGIIISTYIAFYIIPLLGYIPQMLASETQFNDEDKIPVREIVLHFGLIVDPLTYIFFSKQYRDALLMKMRCCLGQNGQQRSLPDDNEITSLSFFVTPGSITIFNDCFCIISGLHLL